MNLCDGLRDSPRFVLPYANKKMTSSVLLHTEISVVAVKYLRRVSSVHRIWIRHQQLLMVEGRTHAHSCTGANTITLPADHPSIKQASSPHCRPPMCPVARAATSLTLAMQVTH